MEDIKEVIYKHAVFNAATHAGRANPGSIMGKVISEIPEVKDDTKNIMKIIIEIVNEVNTLSIDEQKKIIETKYPALLEKKKEEIHELPPLKNHEKVIMRFAPNPDGPLSLGRARTLLLNWFYVQKYRGTFVLRFDDTDPKNKAPIKEAYEWILDDLLWLEVVPNIVVKASDRFDIYYEYAKKLLTMEKAYVCTCFSEEWKELTREKKACPCRERSASEQLNRWNKMFTEFKEGDAVMRIKTDISHKNPAIRDWPAFRIVEKTRHPYKTARVWPLYNFASAIDDHDFEITHVIRGVDLDFAEIRQKYIYGYFGWTYPISLLNGKLIVEGLKSTSQTRKLIEANERSGWDDPRLATLMSLKKRGFTKDAIFQFIKELGLKKSDVEVSIENLASINRKLLDMKVDRYHFVSDPLPLSIKLPIHSVLLKYHPEKEKTREIIIGEKIYISRSDFEKYRGQSVRLKDLATVKLSDPQEYVTDPNHKALQKIQWVSESVPVDIVMPDATIVSGLGESHLRTLKKDDVIQLVRVGFGRIESVTPKKVIIYFSHS